MVTFSNRTKQAATGMITPSQAVYECQQSQHPAQKCRVWRITRPDKHSKLDATIEAVKIRVADGCARQRLSTEAARFSLERSQSCEEARYHRTEIGPSKWYLDPWQNCVWRKIVRQGNIFSQLVFQFIDLHLYLLARMENRYSRTRTSVVGLPTRKTIFQRSALLSESRTVSSENSRGWQGIGSEWYNVQKTNEHA